MGANSHVRLTSASILIVKLSIETCWLNPRIEDSWKSRGIQPSCLLEPHFLQLPLPSQTRCDSPARHS